MPPRQQERFIIKIVEDVLGVHAEERTFNWLKNKHLEEDFGKYYNLIDRIFLDLGGSYRANKEKKTQFLRCDAFFSGGLNFILEFDEFQHFSTARLKTLNYYPKDLKTNFVLDEYCSFCQNHRFEADKYRSNKTTPDFNFAGGRTAQRAYLDCFKDLLPRLHGLNPTMRISEFEVAEITNNDKESRDMIRKIIEIKLKSAKIESPG